MVADRNMCPFLFGVMDYMKNEKFMYQCFMCGKKYQFGPHTKGSIKYFTSVKYFVCHPELVSGSIDAESSSA